MTYLDFYTIWGTFSR